MTRSASIGLLRPRWRWRRRPARRAALSWGRVHGRGPRLTGRRTPVERRGSIDGRSSRCRAGPARCAIDLARSPPGADERSVPLPPPRASRARPTAGRRGSGPRPRRCRPSRKRSSPAFRFGQKADGCRSKARLMASRRRSDLEQRRDARRPGTPWAAASVGCRPDRGVERSDRVPRRSVRGPCRRAVGRRSGLVTAVGSDRSSVGAHRSRRS